MREFLVARFDEQFLPRDREIYLGDCVSLFMNLYSLYRAVTNNSLTAVGRSFDDFRYKRVKTFDWSKVSKSNLLNLLSKFINQTLISMNTFCELENKSSCVVEDWLPFLIYCGISWNELGITRDTITNPNISGDSSWLRNLVLTCC